ncbi:MAG: hypothetical protein KC635_28570, partial [Myxococcales bacterium]|nr:hypothetical protein [Myxococcales bacterium]
APLAAARADLAAFLELLPDDHPVVDLLTGLGETAGEAARRLSRPATPATALHARHAVIEGRVWVRLFGLYQMAVPDLVCAVEPDVPLAAVYDLLTRLGAALLAREAGFPDDRPVPFGYWLLGFGDASIADDDFWGLFREALQSAHLAGAFDDRMETPAPRFVIEAATPDEAEPDKWLVGASRAARTFVAQARALARFDAGRLSDAPCAHDAAIICDRFDATGDFFAYREPPRGDLDSGWRFGCLAADHVHDESTTRLVPLHQAAGRNHELVQYLGFPPGWVVTREDGAWWVSEPGEPNGHEDVASLAAPPWEPVDQAPDDGAPAAEEGA